MVKSKSNKMHLEVNNDLELDISNASTSKRNRRSKKSLSSPISNKSKRVSFSTKTPKRMASKPKMLAKKRSLSKTGKKGSALKSKPLMPSILINGKRVPVKAMKMSSGSKSKKVSRFSSSKRDTSNSRRKASNSSRVSKRSALDPKRKASVSRRKASDSRRKNSVSRRKASVSRRKVSAITRKASEARRRAAQNRPRDVMGRFKKDTQGDETIFMPIQQASDGKTAEAIVVVQNEKDKVDVTDVKIVEK